MHYEWIRNVEAISAWSNDLLSITSTERCIITTVRSSVKDKGTYGVEKGDTEALNNTVQSHELKHTEGGDESRSALPVERRHVRRKTGWFVKRTFVIEKRCLQCWRSKQAPSSTPNDLFSKHSIWCASASFKTKQHPKQFPQKPITHSKTHSLLYI